MAYSKTTWKDRVVQYPNRFSSVDNGDGTVNLTPSVGSITEAGTPVNADNLNNIEDGIVAVNDATYFKEVGGTANVITVNINTTLTDGFPINFIVKFANNGSATTLNGIPIYRPVSLTAPNLIVGQLVTIVYNTANLCFFYKASAEGNADPSKVLAGKTFSNFNQTGLVGTMINNGIVTKSISTAGGYVELPSGYTSGGTVTAPTLAQVITDVTVTNTTQILNGYNAYGVGGTLFNGTNTPYTLIVGMVTTGTDERQTTIITGLPSEPKFMCISYDGFGKQILYSDTPYNYMINLIYDPTHILIGTLGATSSQNVYMHSSAKNINDAKYSNHGTGSTNLLTSYNNGTFTFESIILLKGVQVPYIILV